MASETLDAMKPEEGNDPRDSSIAGGSPVPLVQLLHGLEGLGLNTPQVLGDMKFATYDRQENKNIVMWKIKNVIKALHEGNVTSMISLIIQPGDQISRITKMLEEEYEKASNIKSRVNCLSVLGAITSAKQRLKLYKKVPPNGIVLYSGTIVTDDGVEKKVTSDFAPYKLMNLPTSLHLQDNNFHTEPLFQLLEPDEEYGFIVMDKTTALFGKISGNIQKVLHKFTINRPNISGGEAAFRHACLSYVKRIALLADRIYIDPANRRTNISGGLILAITANFRPEVDLFMMQDFLLEIKILTVVDVYYGGECGFEEAIELSANIMSNVRFFEEKRLIWKFLKEVIEETGKSVYGVDNTMKSLEKGVVEDLIVWENLNINRYVLKNSVSGEVVIKYFNQDKEDDMGIFKDMAVQDKTPLLEWLANEYRSFGCSLEFVNDTSQEGSKFLKTFDGIGAILRYKLSDEDDE